MVDKKVSFQLIEMEIEVSVSVRNIPNELRVVVRTAEFSHRSLSAGIARIQKTRARSVLPEKPHAVHLHSLPQGQ